MRRLRALVAVSLVGCSGAPFTTVETGGAAGSGGTGGDLTQLQGGGQGGSEAGTNGGGQGGSEAGTSGDVSTAGQVITAGGAPDGGGHAGQAGSEPVAGTGISGATNGGMGGKTQGGESGSVTLDGGNGGDELAGMAGELGGTAGAAGASPTGGAAGAEGGAAGSASECVLTPPMSSGEHRYRLLPDCSVCFLETCAGRQYTCGTFIDACGNQRDCGEEPERQGQSADCTANLPVKWVCGDSESTPAPFPLPGPGCELQPTYESPNGGQIAGYYACCPSSLEEPEPQPSTTPGQPFDFEIDQSCDSPTTYYLDHDRDGYGGPLSLRACDAPPNRTIIQGDLTTGAWVRRPGDCWDDSDLVSPVGTGKSEAYLVPWGSAPSYDYDCDGEETPKEPWTEPEACTYDNFSLRCTGGGYEPNGNRSDSGVAGINDYCGSTTSITCAVHVGPYPGTCDANPTTGPVAAVMCQ